MFFAQVETVNINRQSFNLDFILIYFDKITTYVIFVKIYDTFFFIASTFRLSNFSYHLIWKSSLLYRMRIFFNKFENVNWIIWAKQDILFTFDFCIFDFCIFESCIFDFCISQSCTFQSFTLVSTLSNKENRMMQTNSMCIVKLFSALFVVIA